MLSESTPNSEERERVADIIMMKVIYEGREGDTITSEDRDNWQYEFCQEAANAVIAAGYRPQDEVVKFADALGFGDDVTERAATLEEMLDPILEWQSDVRDHFECPVFCDLCGERLAATTCEHCHGSGCGSGTVSGAYEECQWCAGVGKIHEGCVEKSYADLAALATTGGETEWSVRWKYDGTVNNQRLTEDAARALARSLPDEAEAVWHTVSEWVAVDPTSPETTADKS